MPEHTSPGTFWIVVYIILAMLLVLLNGFFVLVEFALVKIRRTRLEQLVADGHVRARLALQMHRYMDEYLSATQLGITMASLGLGWIGEPAFAHVFAGIFDALGITSEHAGLYLSLAFSFCLITFLHILFGELAPKSLAIQQAERAILWSAPLMRFFYLLFYIPLITLTKASNGVLRLLGFKPTREIETAVTDEELRHVLAHSQKRGEFSLDRLLLFENALDFSEMTTQEVMVPIDEADVLNLQQSRDENLNTIREKRHSRYPIQDGDRIIGMAHIKDLAIKALEHAPEVQLADVQRELSAVRDNLPLETLLRSLQRRRQHLALVKDSDGENVGIVTLEDILEELVGEIVDEFDVGADLPLSLGDFISEDRIVMQMSATDPRDAIRLMLGVMGRSVEIDVEAAFDAVWKRESTAPTGLGRQVAIPHARMPDLAEPCVVFARCPNGVDFKAPDGAPARLLFLMLTPRAVPLLQVKLLARIAAMLESDYLSSQLLEAKTPGVVMEIIRTADVAATL